MFTRMRLSLNEGKNHFCCGFEQNLTAHLHSQFCRRGCETATANSCFVLRPFFFFVLVRISFLTTINFYFVCIVCDFTIHYQKRHSSWSPKAITKQCFIYFFTYRYYFQVSLRNVASQDQYRSISHNVQKQNTYI